MNELIPSENPLSKEDAALEQKVSPYDLSYPISFLKSCIEQKFREAEETVREVFQSAVSLSPMLAQDAEALKTGVRYVVDASDDMIDAIEKGIIKLTQENGETFAQIRNGNRYGTKLPIKREAFCQGIDPVQMASALQMKAIQDQIQGIAEQVEIIDSNVMSVLEGQQNDRIGLYLSGIALYLEAKELSDEALKRSILAQALKTLSEASFQLALNMQSDILYLEKGEYKKDKRHQVERIDEHMRRIHQAFGFIHQAMMMRAGIYCEQGEIGAMSSVLSEYGHFIKETIAKNAPLLAECDVTDNGTEEGIWQSRARLELDTSELIRQLSAAKKSIIVYLPEGGNENEN